MKRKLGAILLVVVLAVSLGLVPAASVGANPDPGLVGLWHFDDNADDSSGNGLDGTEYGSPLYVDHTGFGKAISLNGSDQYVSVDDDALLDITSAITVEGWIKLTSFSQPSTVAGKWKDIGTTNQRGYLLTVDTAGKPRFYISTNGGNYPVAIGSAALSLNAWHHLAGTYDGTNIKLYVDGNPVPTTTPQIGGIFLNNESLLIGANDGWGGSSRKFTNGLIDEVRIWDEALTAGQIGDVSAPVVTITAPTDGACYQSSALPIAAYTVSDANSYTVVQSGYSTAERVHTYTVTATDVLGYVGSASVTYTVDNTDPVVTITAPEDGAFYWLRPITGGNSI